MPDAGAGDNTARGATAVPAEARRFPPPWQIGETDACSIVRDANGQALAYVCFKEEPGRRAASAIFKLVEAGDCGRVSNSTSQSLSLCRPAS